jgi:hypothetical protein
VNIFSKISAFVAATSPKVKAGLIWGVLATLAIGWLNSVTPADLAWAGAAEPLLFSAIPIVVGQIAAWIKTDPLRVEGAASLAAKAAAAADSASAVAGNVVASTPVASTTAVSTGPGTVVQSEVVAPASVVVQDSSPAPEQHPVQ